MKYKIEWSPVKRFTYNSMGLYQTSKLAVEKNSHCNMPQEGVLVLLNISNLAGKVSIIKDKVQISGTSQLLFVNH